MDYKTLNNLRLEDIQVRQWEREEKNRILRSTHSPKRKQAQWNKVFPKLALEGLSEKELSKSEVW